MYVLRTRHQHFFGQKVYAKVENGYIYGDPYLAAHYSFIDPERMKG